MWQVNTKYQLMLFISLFLIIFNVAAWWCNIRTSDTRSNGHEFDSQLGHYQVTTLDKLFTPMCLCHQVGLINKVNRHCAQLVLEWVTVCEWVHHLGM